MVLEKSNIARRNQVNKIFNVGKIYTSTSCTCKSARRNDKILDRTFYKFLWNNGPDRISRKNKVKKCESGRFKDDLY